MMSEKELQEALNSMGAAACKFRGHTTNWEQHKRCVEMWNGIKLIIDLTKRSEESHV